MIFARVILPIALLGFAGLAAGPTSAVRAAAVLSPATALARQVGAIAGAAVICEIEQEEQELYHDRVQARIALSAQDEVDLVVARIAFSNQKSHASAVLPEGGCEEFRRQFGAHVEGLK